MDRLIKIGEAVATAAIIALATALVENIIEDNSSKEQK